MTTLQLKGTSDQTSLDAGTPDFFSAEAGPLAESMALNTVDADPKLAMPVTGALTIDGTGGDDSLVVTATGTDGGAYSLNGGPAIAFGHITSLTFLGGSGNDNVTVHNPDGGLFAPTGGVFVHGGTQNGGAGDGLAIEG